MSAQINLYDPRFLKRRELLTLANLTVATVLLYSALAAAGVWAWQKAAQQQALATVAGEQLKAIKDQVAAETKAGSARKPSAQLTAELERAEIVLRRSGEIVRLLESGVVGSTAGFTDYLRGFSRQTPDGLWLTGFNIGAGGKDVEIRGSMTNPGVLPEYIRRLGNEKIFQGRSFAALTMNRAEPQAASRPTGATPGVVQGVAAAPRPIDFVLLPKPDQTKDGKP